MQIFNTINTIITKGHGKPDPARTSLDTSLTRRDPRRLSKSLQAVGSNVALILLIYELLL
jgi:hypothetical protein